MAGVVVWRLTATRETRFCQAAAASESATSNHPHVAVASRDDATFGAGAEMPTANRLGLGIATPFAFVL
ncbi:hypothetical protein B0T26DRAFT_725595 [Lasiosphaeria miniovina]|uniref:Uncharacterized protein n=1 Tax=Lasiosphaeria miniovina TaxID=1954250 RepID=A0AA39ZYV3_9PEZI|nr:uncharacterized protein B0T26DRAFT_725595 [Lasiosphaeria miniovina]KAK0706150.1 hypothetical protein B0T26DRAFT_725595 [Lasiosphaeria miniovina]